MSYTLRISLFVLLQILLFTNVNAQNVARIGETYYSSLTNAINVCRLGETIVLLEDIEMTSDIAISSGNVCIDLNGHSIINNHSYTITIGTTSTDAIMTIKGEGEIKSLNKDNKKFVQVSSRGTLNLYSATIKAESSGNLGVVNNQGEFNMYGGCIKNTNEAISNLYNVSVPENTLALNIGASAIANINGGSIVSNKLAISNSSSNLTIKNNTIISGFVKTTDVTNINIPEGLIVYSTNGSGKNIVNYNVSNWAKSTCELLNINDNYGYSVPFSITVNSAKYTRYMSKGWGTLCLPFAIDIVNSDVECYQIIAVSGEELVLSRYNENVPAGTPVIIKKKDDSKNEIVVVGSGSTCITPSTDTNMKGAFEQTYIQSKTNENYYFISNNKFWNAEVSTLVYPYRAYFTYPSFNPLSPKWKPAQSFDITISDEEITSVNSQENTDFDINSIYDIDGKILNGLQQGINIVKLSNGQTKKILVR